MKRNLLTLLIILLSVIYGGNNLSAQNVAKVKVGNTETEYATIDEAIAAWEASASKATTTMTLMTNVELPRPITLKSTAHHILNLGEYTMTAADGEHAIVIKACGLANLYGGNNAHKNALTINADANNIGGIDAGSKSVVYYNYDDGDVDGNTNIGNDRPIITITGGQYWGSTTTSGISSAGIYMKGKASSNSPNLTITGGIFNCSIGGITKCKMVISGGRFNYAIRSTGDSTSNCLISGGTFISLPNATMDRENKKFWIGSAMANSDKGIYVNNDGYYVVGGPIIKDYTDVYKCSFIPVYNQNNPSTGESDPLRYSSANPTPLPGMKKGTTTLNGQNPTPNPNPNQNGLYYTSIKVALDNNNSSSKTVNIHTGTLDLKAETKVYTYNGTINLPKENSTFTVIYNKSYKPSFITNNNKIVTNTGGTVVFEESNSGNIYTRTYRVRNDVAKINTTYYESLSDAYTAANGNVIIEILKNFEEEGLELNKNVTINFNTFTYTATSEITVAEGKTITLQNGTINVTGENVIVNNGTISMDNLVLNGSGSNIVFRGSGIANITSTCKVTNGYLEYYGGELFNQSTNIPAIAKKDFDGIGAVQGQTGWSTISTPIANAAIPKATAGTHDLYRFDEPEQEWEYYNDADGQTFKKLELGRGYLYTNSHDITFQLEGNLNAASVSYTLSYTEGNSLAGFNMIGNPFTHTITRSNITTSPSGALSTGFYVVGAEGTWTAKADGKIAPMESVLIQADRAANLTIAPSTPNNGSKRAARNENSYLTINVASKTHSDVAYVSFNDGMGLDKINHRNPDNPMLYIPVEGKNYAIAMMNQDVKEVPVYFNANRMAEYTISIEQKNCEFSSVVLVDKLTGVETNMLIEDYSFMARSFDNADRFIIRLSIEDNSDSESENFAFISNGSIVIEKIEGNANIRIFDIMGRHISQHSVSGSASIATDAFATGMYIIQMSDDNGVKVQKIIID